MADRSKFRLIAAILTAGLALAACRDTGEGDHFALDGKLVVFNYRVATATFLVNLKPLRPVGNGEVAIALFDDPAGGAPIEVREKIWPNLSKITINTPPLRCIVKDKPYKVSIRIEDASGQRKCRRSKPPSNRLRTNRTCLTGRSWSVHSTRRTPNSRAIPTASCLARCRRVRREWRLVRCEKRVASCEMTE